jgi:adenylylsulfate kinase-like enzyme
VIVWLNGTFGAGKTTTAALLAARDGRLRTFDPEWVGYLLRANLSGYEVTDFQQWPSWRTLTPIVIDEVARFTGQHLVAVQTVLVEDYWRELRAGLDALGHEVLHVLLEADEAVMTARIEADEVETTARGGRLAHLPVFADARPWMVGAADLVVDTTDLTAEQAADTVFEVVNPRLVP